MCIFVPFTKNSNGVWFHPAHNSSFMVESTFKHFDPAQTPATSKIHPVLRIRWQKKSVLFQKKKKEKKIGTFPPPAPTGAYLKDWHRAVKCIHVFRQGLFGGSLKIQEIFLSF